MDAPSKLAPGEEAECAIAAAPTPATFKKLRRVAPFGILYFSRAEAVYRIGAS
jgi:hypothetical protein